MASNQNNPKEKDNKLKLPKPPGTGKDGKKPKKTKAIGPLDLPSTCGAPDNRDFGADFSICRHPELFDEMAELGAVAGMVKDHFEVVENYGASTDTEYTAHYPGTKIIQQYSKDPPAESSSPGSEGSGPLLKKGSSIPSTDEDHQFQVGGGSYSPSSKTTYRWSDFVTGAVSPKDAITMLLQRFEADGIFPAVEFDGQQFHILRTCGSPAGSLSGRKVEASGALQAAQIARQMQRLVTDELEAPPLGNEDEKPALVSPPTTSKPSTSYDPGQDSASIMAMTVAKAKAQKVETAMKDPSHKNWTFVTGDGIRAKINTGYYCADCPPKTRTTKKKWLAHAQAAHASTYLMNLFLN